MSQIDPLKAPRVVEAFQRRCNDGATMKELMNWRAYERQWRDLVPQPEIHLQQCSDAVDEQTMHRKTTSKDIVMPDSIPAIVDKGLV